MVLNTGRARKQNDTGLCESWIKYDLQDSGFLFRRGDYHGDRVRSCGSDLGYRSYLPAILKCVNLNIPQSMSDASVESTKTTNNPGGRLMALSGLSMLKLPTAESGACGRAKRSAFAGSFTQLSRVNIVRLGAAEFLFALGH
jgi:hypothetical protein